MPCENLPILETPQMTRRPLTIGAFRRYLENASPRLRMETCSEKMCPIGRYYGNSPRSSNVIVRSHSLYVHGGKRLDLPAWAVAFVWAVDSAFKPHTKILPAKALEILMASGYRKG
jgi:hypothetical protein